MSPEGTKGNQTTTVKAFGKDILSSPQVLCGHDGGSFAGMNENVSGKRAELEQEIQPSSSWRKSLIQGPPKIEISVDTGTTNVNFFSAPFVV